MSTILLRTGSILSFLSGGFLFASSFFGIVNGLPREFDVFLAGIESAWQVVLFASLGVFSQVLVIPTIAIGYSYAFQFSSIKKKIGILVVVVGSTIISMAFWHLLESVRRALSAFGTPNPAAIPAILRTSEIEFTAYTALDPVGAFLIYGCGIGILTSLLVSGKKSRPIVGLSLLTSILGLSMIGLYAPEPVTEIFRILSIVLPLIYVTLAIVLGFEMMMAAKHDEEVSGKRGLLVACVAGLLGVVSLAVYVVFLDSLISYTSTYHLLHGWHSGGLVAVACYSLIVISLPLGVVGTFAISQSALMNAGSPARLAGWIVASGYGVLLSSVGALSVIVLMAMNDITWFYSELWPPIEDLILRVAQAIRPLFVCGVIIVSLGILLLAFSLVRSSTRRGPAILVSVVSICLLFTTGLLITEPPAEFPGPASLLAGLLLSLFSLSMGLLFHRGTVLPPTPKGHISDQSQPEVAAQ